MSLGQDLADFLTARIAEDEERGRSLVSQWYDVGNACQSCGTDGARVLAECAAKRKIVEELRLVSAHADTEYDSGRVDAFTASLLLLADVYADHPDYDQAWRP